VLFDRGHELVRTETGQEDLRATTAEHVRQHHLRARKMKQRRNVDEHLPGPRPGGQLGEAGRENIPVAQRGLLRPTGRTAGRQQQRDVVPAAAGIRDRARVRQHLLVGDRASHVRPAGHIDHAPDARHIGSQPTRRDRAGLVDEHRTGLDAVEQTENLSR
jgi:hypothetical protein